MSASTGPVLAIGAITMLNQSVFNDQPVDLRVPVATAIAAGLLSLAERAVGPAVASGVAYVALVTVLFTRIQPNVPSPTESALRWYQGG